MRPLWRGAHPFAQAPQLLRFASDDFMDQLIATLAEEPARLSDRIARFETWRDPPQPVDKSDPILRVALPAPMKDAKRRRLREWLLLTLRVAAVALLAVGFARPYIPTAAAGAACGPRR